MEDELENYRRLNGESNFADKAPEMVQLRSRWIDNDKEDSAVKIVNDPYKVQYTSFAQEQKELEDELERKRRLNGESNFADKAPEMIQLNSKWVDNDKEDEAVKIENDPYKV